MSVAWLSESNESMTVTFGTSKLNLNQESVPATISRYTIDDNYWTVPSWIDDDDYDSNATFANYTSNWSVVPVHDSEARSDMDAS